MHVIETEKLCKFYVRDVIDTEYGRLRIRFRNRRTEALKDLTLTVDQGEIFGLLGPNGAGKTTTIKILMGIHYPTSGTARILGKPLNDRSMKERIGFLPENPYFYDYLQGWEFLDFYGQLYGLPKARRYKKIEELLDLVGLTHAANRPLRGYSKGMNQRIGLAQSLMNDPEVVFLDEPQSGLDPIGRKEVRDIILRLREQGKTVFFSSHILADAEMICDRVGIVFQGKLISIGHINELLSKHVTEWEVVVRGVDPAALERWTTRAERHTKNAEDHLLIVKDKGLMEEIVNGAVGGGGELVSLTPRRESLEDYFLREIGAGG